MAKKGGIVETWIDKPQRILVGGLVIGLGGYVAYKLGGALLKNMNKNSAEAKVGDNLEVQQATVLRSAMNPSGISWMMSFDTTDSDTILATSHQIVKLEDVLSYYKKLYDSNLLEDLQSELSTEDYKKFIAIVSGNTNKKSGTAQSYAKKEQLIVATKEVYVRRTPDASYHEAWYESSSGNNIIVKAKAGAFIGYATGKQQYDSKNDVKFIEVGYQYIKKGIPANMQKYAGKTYLFWISSSTNFIDKFNSSKEMLAKYPTLANEVYYKKPLGTLSGFDELFSIPVISKQQCFVLDSQMKSPVQVQKGTLLGEYVMSLDTGNSVFVKFKTIDNTERWVDAKTVVLKNS